MSEQDRHKWNQRYQQAENVPMDPSGLLTELDDVLPRSGRGLDIAGGAGRHAVWLARRGLEMTVADVADQGLSRAQLLARQANVVIETVRVDLEEDPFPAGPWDLILSFHYLWRPLFCVFPQQLSQGGLLIFAQPTRSNLTRHAKPRLAYLLEDGELPSLVEGLEIVRYQEGWLADGRHGALLVARRP